MNAIILAAGYGMRMVPINSMIPKGLIEIKGEPLIERIIKQLHEQEIDDICIVVGFMKEKYQYLKEKYNVKIIENNEYNVKNNLYSLYKAIDYLNDTYIIPCHIYCVDNLFRKNELKSWYMCYKKEKRQDILKLNKNNELVLNKNTCDEHKMTGIAYISTETSKIIKKKLKQFAKDDNYDDFIWEKTLFEKNKMIVDFRRISRAKIIEINTYEDLRAIDENSKHLKNSAIETICNTFDCLPNMIKNIKVLKKGMTNRSFLFSLKSQKYIMRIPGEGTEQLINRKQETKVYEIIKNKNLCDEVIYINSLNGYKITKYFENVKTIDCYDNNDLYKAMKKLKEFHNMKLEVSHEFNIWEQIEFYEKLWNGKKSIYNDYEKTKKQVKSLKCFIEKNIKQKVLTHIDAVPDNFLIVNKNKKNEEIKLIDWEYAGMQDPDIDIAMFCIYAMYDRKHIDNLIDIYYKNNCSKNTRCKIYCYIAVCGLLWSNWCEYKRQLGIDLGEYPISQYNYAKEYFKIVTEEYGGVLNV